MLKKRFLLVAVGLAGWASLGYASSNLASPGQFTEDIASTTVSQPISADTHLMLAGHGHKGYSRGGYRTSQWGWGGHGGYGKSYHRTSYRGGYGYWGGHNHCYRPPVCHYPTVGWGYYGYGGGYRIY